MVIIVMVLNGPCSVFTCSPQNFCNHVNANLKEFGATRVFKGNCNICCPGGKEAELARVREYRKLKQARRRAEAQVRYDAIKARIRQEQQAPT